MRCLIPPMEDRDFRSWQITPEQADRISQGDKLEAIAFYMSHRERLETMARNYAMTHNEGHKVYLYQPEEMTSQVLLDLPFLNWKNALTLTMSLKQTSFAWSAYGGYAQRFQAGQLHTGNPWDRVPDFDSLDSPLFEEDEDGASLLDRYVTAPEDETPEGILLKSETVKPLTAEQIVERLIGILSQKEAEFLKLYLEGLSFTQISESLGIKDCSCLKEQSFSKLVRRYCEVIDLVFNDRGIPPDLEGLVPDKYEEIQRKYDERIAKKRKGDKPKRVFASDAERQQAAKESRRKWYEKNKELQKVRKQERRREEREAKRARAVV